MEYRIHIVINMKRYFLVVMMSIGFASCGIYRANVVNVPLLEERGQAEIGGHISVTGYDGQASIAATEHIGIMANISGTGTVRDGNSTNYTVDKHAFKEVGAGYYSHSQEGRAFELYLLAGNGSTSHAATGGDTLQGHTAPFFDSKEVHYRRYLLQANYGGRDDKIEWAISPRLFVLHYYDIHDNTSIAYKNIPSTYLYSDVAFTLRYEVLPSVRLSTQCVLTVPLADTYKGYYEASPFNCSIGIIVDMNVF